MFDIQLTKYHYKTRARLVYPLTVPASLYITRFIQRYIHKTD